MPILQTALSIVSKVLICFLFEYMSHALEGLQRLDS